MYFPLWIVGALASFCILAIGARELSGELSIAQSLCIRSAIGLVFLSFVYLLNFRKTGQLQKSYFNKPYGFTSFKLHFVRNIFHYVAQHAWFFGIGVLPLAEVFALEFTVPIWTLLIASLFLGEKITKVKLTAIFLGIIGVLVIVQPGYAIIDTASFVVLGAAICFAVSHTVTKKLSLSQPPFSILFYMCAMQLPIALCLSFTSWQWPIGLQWLWLTVIALSALSAHFCLAKAMKYADITTIVTLDFLRLPLIAFIGVILYAETLQLLLFLGGALMLMANLVNLHKKVKV